MCTLYVYIGNSRNRLLHEFLSLFCEFPDYDPAYVPTVYPGEDLDSARQRELVERQRQEQEEADRRAAAEAAATTQAPDIDLRIDDNINEIDNERKTIRPDLREPSEYLTTSTTLRPTKRRPNKQDPICKLPVDADYGEFDVGYRFGTKNDSRIEYYEVPAKFKKSYELTLEFKTKHPDGILFYAAGEHHSDFVVLYMKDGYVYHKFNCGSGPANMTSKYQYNNDDWHTVRIERTQATGTLVIDGGDSAEGSSVGNTRVMSLQPPYTFGGVNEKSIDDASEDTGLVSSNIYRGCIRNIQVNAQPLGVPTREFGVLPCTDQIEDGVFFGGGYVKVSNKNKTANELFPICRTK